MNERDASIDAATILERLVSDSRRGGRLVLVFDYDGTLVPFAAYPDLARLDPAVRNILARLAALPRVTVAVISGRGLSDVAGMVGLPDLHYGGSTGLELELAGVRHLPVETPKNRLMLEGLIAALEARLASYPGAWMEKKPFGFTVHYRQVTTDRADAVRADTLALLDPHADDLQVLEGPLSLEVGPDHGRNKGTALRAIHAHGGAEPATVLYAGDSANDAPALAVAAELGGIALGIGPEPPAEATARLPDPAALIALLTVLAADLAAIPSDVPTPPSP